MFCKATFLFVFYFSNYLLKMSVFRMTYTNQHRAVKLTKKKKNKALIQAGSCIYCHKVLLLW